MASIAYPDHSKQIDLSDGTHYGYVKVAPQPGKPTLLFLHGYPSSSFCWHHQIKQCISAGYGVIAPDFLGYGDTSAPTEIAAYDCTKISKQIAEILDAERISTVIAVGHDWGAGFLSVFARRFTKRISLLIFIAIGYGHSAEIMTDMAGLGAQLKQLFGRDLFAYWQFHNKPEAASLIDNTDPLVVTSLVYPADPTVWIKNMCEPGGAENWIKEKKTTELAPWFAPDYETHVKIMKKNGYTGPLNWYKQVMAGITFASEARDDPDHGTKKFDIPALFIGCALDYICVPAMQQAGMKDYFSDYTAKVFDTGHWAMLEKPQETWDTIVEWIEEKQKTA